MNEEDVEKLLVILGMFPFGGSDKKVRKALYHYEDVNDIIEAFKSLSKTVDHHYVEAKREIDRLKEIEKDVKAMRRVLGIDNLALRR